MPASKGPSGTAELPGGRGTDSLPVTERQLEILRNVARGRTNREIGETLGISELTVRNHMRSILKRLSSADRTHAVVIAIGNGWIPIPIEPEGSPMLADGSPAPIDSIR